MPCTGVGAHCPQYIEQTRRRQNTTLIGENKYRVGSGREPPHGGGSARKSLKLHLQEIDLDLVGAHSLRAGGTMALKLHGYDNTAIMNMERWKSLNFLKYIHNQIAHLSKDIYI